ncbi:MAG: four helix bundle protein [Dehalococcoidia bacterium]|nr:four helix bundle protein [Dehalococcoidia bacterium]
MGELDIQKTQRGFRDLVAWQKADQLASGVYRAVKNVPPGHLWLVDQMLRSAISVPANIAEGHGRGTRAELARFVDIARGSLAELEYYIHFVANEGLLSAEQIERLEEARREAGRVLFGLWRSLKTMPKTDWDHTGKRVREDEGIYTV